MQIEILLTMLYYASSGCPGSVDLQEVEKERLMSFQVCLFKFEVNLIRWKSAKCFGL